MIRTATTWVIAILALLLVTPMGGGAQEPDEPAIEDGPGTLRLFLDCQRCNFDHFRREVPYVSYVRDREDAQLHVLVTTRSTGGGGTEYTFAFIGLGESEGHEATLVWRSSQGDTQDEIRAGQVRTFQLGLMPYLAGTPMADRISIAYEGVREEGEAIVPEEDPWNFWVFSLRVGGSVEGEERQRELSVDGSAEASRVTEDLKVELETEAEWNEDVFELSDRTQVSTTRSYSTEALVVWSMGPHWSVGGQASARTSTRDNQDLTLRAGPAVEYSIYPYAESTRRQITLQYRIGVASYDYEEITIFDRLSEVRGEQSVELSADFTQPWGELGGALEVEMFLDDPSQHRIDLDTDLELRLTRGLSLDIRGEVSRIKNQIFLPREDIPDEDILLRRRQLGTDYRYELNVGIRYTFGSIFSNVVNPRLDQGGGGWW